MKLLKTQDELERMLLERLHSAGYPRAQRPKLSPIERPGEWEVVVARRRVRQVAQQGSRGCQQARGFVSRQPATRVKRERVRNQTGPIEVLSVKGPLDVMNRLKDYFNEQGHSSYWQAIDALHVIITVALVPALILCIVAYWLGWHNGRAKAMRKADQDIARLQSQIARLKVNKTSLINRLTRS